MKYKSMDDLRNLSDTEVEDFLKRYWKTDDFIFYGIFVPNTENPDNYSGMMTRVKVPGNKTWLKYPLSDIGFVQFKIPSNKKLESKFYKFSCRLLPNYNNRCQLQILLNTLEEVDARTYNFVGIRREPKTYSTNEGEKHLSPLAYRYQLLEDEETGWGKDIQQLMGIYKKTHDGNYYLDDIRRTDLTKLQTYPKTTFRVGPLPLQAPIEGLTEGQYCLFNWKFTFKVKVNPCEIEVDESKPIVFVSPEELLSAINNSEASKFLSVDDGTTPDDPSVLIYDLLYEANKYTETPVDVQFNLTDKYLSFQHTGRPLSAEEVLRLSGLDDRTAELKDNPIAYHCQGLRQFLLANKQTLIISNGFFVNFSHIDGKLKPTWQDKATLPREIKISLARNKRFTETIILPFAKDDKSTANNYKAGLHCVLEDVENIAFFQSIGKVVLKIKGSKPKTLDRKDWVVSKEYLSFIPKDVREKINNKDGKNPADVSEKTSYKKHTSIMFACKHKGNALVGEEDAPAYCMLPTTSSFGFPFLMNLDIVINKTNYAVSRKSGWNKAYAEIAGRLFAKWITDLSVKQQYTAKSIYGIVPKFDDCLAEHPEEKTFISLFQKGFKDVIMNEKEKPETTETQSQETTEEATPKKPGSYKRKNATRNTRNEQGKIYVIDTNIFVNCPDIISKIGSNNTVIISAKVVDELDNLKYKMEDKDLRDVQKALKNINQEIDKGNVHMEMSDVTLLPRDFDRHNPDNNILSVVLRHKAESPTLLSSDNGLQIKAKGLGINVIGLKEFLASRGK